MRGNWSMKSIYIPGVPDVKMRPRFSRKTRRAYDPNEQAKEASIQKAQITGDQETYDQPLYVVYEFVFPRPKGHFGTGKNAGILKGSSPRHCTVPKDLDNMEKFYADSFNFTAYRDDCQIVESKAKKRYVGEGEMPFVKMDIYPLDIE